MEGRRMKMSELQKKALREIATGKPVIHYARGLIGAEFTLWTLHTLCRKRLVSISNDDRESSFEIIELTDLGKQALSELNPK